MDDLSSIITWNTEQERTKNKMLIRCKFNIDTNCVELKYADGTLVSIDTIAVENEVADNMYERSELDYLIYNEQI